MPRSPLTLAATVTAALPGAEVVGVRTLGSTDGPIDAAVAQLADGRNVVVRIGRTEDARRDLTAEARALGILSAGIRRLLPFRAPQLLGQTLLGTEPAIVVDFIDGYRVDATDVPAGEGVASLLGRAIAALHDLPVTVLRAEGVPARSPEQSRADAHRTIERADAAGALPRVLRTRWRTLVDDDAAWRFEPTVVLDGIEANAFVLAGGERAGQGGESARIVGLLGWQGLAIADPAVDLRWTASAPAAASAVHDAYARTSHRAPDASLAARARLYAELEFAKWLAHGADIGDDQIVHDAEALLASLVDTTAEHDLARPAGHGVDDAIALLERMPAPADSAVDTSMQTDAYDPAMLDGYLADEQRDGDEDAASATAPVDLSGWAQSTERAADPGSGAGVDHHVDTESAHDAAEPDEVDEAARASQAALRRWSQSG